MSQDQLPPVTERPPTPWWTSQPQVWAREAAAFATAGMTTSLESEDPAELRRVHVTVLLGEVVATVTVTYPSTYPWFPPTVEDKDHSLGDLVRHRGPTGLLCLIEPESWRVDMTAAELVTTQLPVLLAHQDTDPGLGQESVEPERAAGSGSYLANSAILIDTAWSIPEDLDAGYLTWRCGESSIGFIGAITDIRTPDGNPVATTQSRFRRTLRYELTGRWVRHRGRLPSDWTAEGLWAAVAADLPEAREIELPRAGRRRSEMLDLVAVLIPDEVAHRRVDWTWLLLTWIRVGRRRNPMLVAVRAEPGGVADLTARTPEAVNLRDTKVIIAGVGALGSRIASDLAAAGVGELDLIDHDRVTAANLARLDVSYTTIGTSKAIAVGSRVVARAPHTTVRITTDAIGSTNQAESHRDTMRLIRVTDLVIDATAAPAATRYLAHHARAAAVGFLHASATPGAWGGTVVHLPGAAGAACWACLEHHRAGPGWLTPPADPAGLIPAGCAETTFTGTSADLAAISSHAARLAQKVLLHSEPGAIHAVCSLRDRVGEWMPAAWTTQPLAIHADCPRHQPADSQLW